MPAHYILHGPHELAPAVSRLLDTRRHWWARHVDARVDDAGQVWLQGRVRSYYEKQLAQESIRHLEGIRRIRNELCVVR